MLLNDLQKMLIAHHQLGMQDVLRMVGEPEAAPPIPPRTAIIFTASPILPAKPKPQGKFLFNFIIFFCLNFYFFNFFYFKELLT